MFQIIILIYKSGIKGKITRNFINITSNTNPLVRYTQQNKTTTNYNLANSI